MESPWRLGPGRGAEPKLRRVSAAAAQPIGVVLAGGAARRLGGAKATAALGGVALVEYPLAALRAAVGEVAVVAKPDTVLPQLSGVTVWREPADPRHALTGIVAALQRAGGRPVLVCAVDLPFVDAQLLTRVAAAPGTVVHVAGQPLVGRYDPAVAAELARAVREGRSVVQAVAGLAPTVIACEDPAALFNVNTPEDLAAAEAILAKLSRT